MRAAQPGIDRGGANVASNLSRFRHWAKKLVGAITAHKRTEITIETTQVVVIERRRSTRDWCPRCGCEVDMVGLSQAVVISASNQALPRDSAKSRLGQDGLSPAPPIVEQATTSSRDAK